MKQSTLGTIALSDLCSQLVAHLESIHMMPRTISNYNVVMRKLQQFAEKRGANYYSDELINSFIQEKGVRERFNDPGHMYYRTCRMIQDLAQGSVPRQSYSRHSTAIALSFAWDDCVNKYKSFLSSRLQSSVTIKTKLERLKSFFLFLMKAKVLSLDDLNPLAITDFIYHASQTYKPIYKYNLLQSLKDFLLFLHSASLVTSNYGLLLSSLPNPGHSALPTPYSIDEIRTILGSVDRSTLMGKRDFAIIQMIAQTGIRAIDVANLKLENICPDSHEIRFVQHKTGRMLSLALTDDLSTSLYDYLLSASSFSTPMSR